MTRTREQIEADIDYWMTCSRIEGQDATGWDMGGVSYKDMMWAARGMLSDGMQAADIHSNKLISGAIEQVLQDARRRMLLRQARERRGVA